MTEGRACPQCGEALRDGLAVCSKCTPAQTATTVGADGLASPSARAPQPAPIVGGYRILCPLGSGGMGAVFLAEDVVLGRRVAIKVIASRKADDEVARERFLREARAMATVEHPHVVRLYSFGG
jgi:serine/threonine protein kinase